MIVETKERPIIFSASMVRAILANRKTQTRRFINPQPDGIVNGAPCWNNLGINAIATEYPLPKSPYGKVGDVLYVREAWAYHADDEAEGVPINEAGVFYRADHDSDPHINRWRPSIHMHRMHSRIKLLVKDVRIEPLQEISKDDSKAEGISYNTRGLAGWSEDPTSWSRTLDPRLAFRRLWDSINGKKESRDWASNPWVWVVEFERLTMPTKNEIIAGLNERIAELEEYVRFVPGILINLHKISDELIEMAYREGSQAGGHLFEGVSTEDELWEASSANEAMKAKK